MTEPFRRLPLALLVMTAVAVLAACTAPASQEQRAAPPSASSAPPAAGPGAADATTTLVVPAGQDGGALSVPRQLTVPSGWTARVWARVPGARMEAWTPQGD